MIVVLNTFTSDLGQYWGRCRPNKKHSSNYHVFSKAENGRSILFFHEDNFIYRASYEVVCSGATFSSAVCSPPFISAEKSFNIGYQFLPRNFISVSRKRQKKMIQDIYFSFVSNRIRRITACWYLRLIKIFISTKK